MMYLLLVPIVAGHPLDTIKVRIQTQDPKNPIYSGMIDCAKKSMSAEGPFALYKGIGAPLAGVTPMYALCFLGYGYGKELFCDKDAFKELKLGQIGMAGAFSAVFTTPILAPGERAKCIQQTQTAGGQKAKYNGVVDIFKGLYREAGGGFAGVRSCCKGFSATLSRDAVASMFYFSSYEWLKAKLTPEGADGPGTASTLFAGGVAGILNWAGALPIDTMKSQYQIAEEGVFSGTLLGPKPVYKEILRNEGIGGFYRGAVPVMARAFPANAACFYGYETAISVLDSVGLE